MPLADVGLEVAGISSAIVAGETDKWLLSRMDPHMATVVRGAVEGLTTVITHVATAATRPAVHQVIMWLYFSAVKQNLDVS